MLFMTSSSGSYLYNLANHKTALGLYSVQVEHKKNDFSLARSGGSTSRRPTSARRTTPAKTTTAKEKETKSEQKPETQQPQQRQDRQ